MQFFGIEEEFFSLQNVSVNTTRLTRARRDTSKETTGPELVRNGRIEHTPLVPLSQLANNSLAFLLFLLGSGLLHDLLGGPGLLAGLHGFFFGVVGKINPVVGVVPLAEWLGINLNNAVLHQSIGPHQLVVGGIVHNPDNSDLLGDSLGSPGEVTVVKTKSTMLDVPSTAPDIVDFLGAQLGHRRGATQLKLSLLAEGDMATGGSAALVHRITRDTWGEEGRRRGRGKREGKWD